MARPIMALGMCVRVCLRVCVCECVCGSGCVLVRGRIVAGHRGSIVSGWKAEVLGGGDGKVKRRLNLEHLRSSIPNILTGYLHSRIHARLHRVSTGDVTAQPRH